MRFFIPLLSFFIFLLSCNNKVEKKVIKLKPKMFSEVEIQVLIEDSTLNVRALEFVENKNAVFATSDGRVGEITINKATHKAEVIFAPKPLKIDTLLANFRALAITNKAEFLLSIGSPAYLFKRNKKDTYVVYKENHSKAFYDSIDFWNDQEGIAIGDPTNNCMSIIVTRDGGETWNKLTCESLPKAKKGEAAFAASDTNIKIIGNKTWIATGGKASRVLFSPDKGKTWEVFNTPVIQGTETAGMFSIDFYDELNGYAIGGDYTKPDNNTMNKIRTKDGGKTWSVAADNKNPGYRSCVQYIPNCNAKSLVTVGFKGIDISNDYGKNWKHLSNQSYYTLRFLNDSTAYAAGKGRISKLVFR